MITRLPFSLFVSLKYLRGRHRHRWISLINIFSIFGIALGVMALIVVLSVMGGFDRDLKKRILGVYAPITLGGEGPIEDYPKILEQLALIPQIKGASAFVSGQILARVRNRVYGVYLRAIEPDKERETTAIQEYLVQGNMDFDSVPQKRGIVIGNELARHFRLKLGDSVELLSPVSIPTPLGLSSHSLSFKVIGIFDSGMYEYDLNLIYITLEAGQELYALGKSVTGITVRVDDLKEVFKVKELIRTELDLPPPDVGPTGRSDEVGPASGGTSGGGTILVRTWLEMNKNLFRAVLTEKWMMFWILLLIVLVAAFNIASSLIMMVMEKTKEIGILKAIGATGGCVLRIFLIQGLMIGVVGTLLGYLGGIVLTLNLNTISNAVARWTGFEFFPKDVYYLDQIPTLLDLKQAALVAICALILSLLAALYPAFQASRMNPVEAIRYE